MPSYLSPGVYVEEVQSGSRPIEGVGTAVAAFVGFAEKGPVNKPTLIANWSQFTNTFGDFIDGSYLAHSVYGYFSNGGGVCYIVRIGASDGAAVVTARAELAAVGAAKGNGLAITAVEGGEVGNSITIEVTDGPDGSAPDVFNLTVKVDGQLQETYEGVTTKRGKTNVATAVNAASKLIRIADSTANIESVTRGTTSLAGGGHSAPAAVSATDYVGDPAARTGFGGLEAIDEVTMVSAPDLMAAFQQGMIDLESVKTVQTAMINHCELMGDRMAILDTPPNLNVQEVKDWRVSTTGYDSKYAALYWPWVKVLDPPSGKNIFIPPSGIVGGVWSRNDDVRGVHKAPANEVVRGVVDIELNISKVEHDLLNPVGINVIRSFPGKGIKIWGARTLSSDASWRYINVRRLFNYLEKSILNGTDWVVFEPNDPALWSRIRRTIAAFLVNEWRKGALFGYTADQAFFVKCDDETNPSESIDAGQVVCEIGVAPVKPAEFVIFRLSQFSGGTSLVAE
ncbi:MAG: phage tail sheath family protein [Actinomycetota bacterium]|nr:phage tail sheath family protein [Actinomycetota bacterium]